MDAGYVVTEDGEKVLPGSRRPDGTIRKERKIRAGYTPQDEQPVYQSVGGMARRHVPKCPGLDPEQESAASAAAKSKAAKKNEKRKAKKAEVQTAGGGGGQQQPSPSAAAAAPRAAPKQQQQQQPSSSASSSTTTAGAGAGAGGAGGQSSALDPTAALLDKQIKALSKKVRQCQALVDRSAAGEALSQQEAEKVAKMQGWQEEIRDLEHQLAKLAT